MPAARRARVSPSSPTRPHRPAAPSPSTASRRAAAAPRATTRPAASRSTPAPTTPSGSSATASGLRSSTLTREDGTLSADTCSSYSGPATLVGTPAQNGLALGCYRYTLTGIDNVGNTVTVSTVVKVDTTNPTSAADALPAFTGTTSIAVTYTSSDTGGSGVDEVELWAKGPARAPTCSPTPTRRRARPRSPTPHRRAKATIASTHARATSPEHGGGTRQRGRGHRARDEPADRALALVRLVHERVRDGDDRVRPRGRLGRLHRHRRCDRPGLRRRGPRVPELLGRGRQRRLRPGRDAVHVRPIRHRSVRRSDRHGHERRRAHDRRHGLHGRGGHARARDDPVRRACRQRQRLAHEPARRRHARGERRRAPASPRSGTRPTAPTRPPSARSTPARSPSRRRRP